MNLSRRGFFSLLTAAPAAAAVAQPSRLDVLCGTAQPAFMAREREAAPIEWSKDIVRRALIRIGVLAPGEHPERALEEHGLATLSDLLEATHKANNPYSLERYHLIGTLAQRLQPEFSPQLTRLDILYGPRLTPAWAVQEVDD